jgi:Tfp pilus assembly PilM family ATPase
MMTALSPRDEISSTEKLLDLIRNGASGSEVSAAPVPPRIPRVPAFLKKVPFLHKRISVGVDIGYTHLVLVKMAQLSESRCKLLDYKSIPFNPNVPKHSPDFHQFLKSSVTDFCGLLRNVNLWTSISAAQVDVTQIRIPRVAKKELFNAIFWTAKREMNFDEKEAIFDYEMEGDVIEDGIPKMRVMTYTAPKDAVKETKELFAKSGLPLTGITISSFAVQNLFRAAWVATSNIATMANLFLSDAYSRIAIYSDGNLALTREIKTGVDSLIISIVESHNGGKEAPSSLEALEKKLDALEVNWERAKAMLFDVGASAPQAPRESVAVQPEDEEVLEMVRPALERLIRQVERTFEFYARLGKGKPVERIFISGAVDIRGAIISNISHSLGIKTEIMDPLNPAIPFLTEAMPPASISARALFTSTLGLALSNNSRTPNLLFTFVDKEEQAAVTRINRSIFVVFMSVISVLFIYFLWQGHVSNQRHAEISKLQQELTQLSPPVDENLVMQTAGMVKSEQRILKGRANEYLGIAVLSELAALTPANIKLISITSDFGRLQEGPVKDANPEQKKTVSRSLVIDGIVQGDSGAWEASLAHYLMRLGSSLVFINPTVYSSTPETYQEVGEVLHFILKMGLV